MANTVTTVVDMGQYPRIGVLVDTERIAQHLNDSNVCLIKADEGALFYETGYLPNAVKLDWHSDVLRSPDRAHPERMWTLIALGGLEP